MKIPHMVYVAYALDREEHDRISAVVKAQFPGFWIREFTDGKDKDGIVIAWPDGKPVSTNIENMVHSFIRGVQFGYSTCEYDYEWGYKTLVKRDRKRKPRRPI